MTITVLLPMLHEFLSSNRAELIDRCRQKVAQRTAPTASPSEVENGIPVFLDQLIATLQVEQSSDPASRNEAALSGGRAPASPMIGRSATLHGSELLKQGFTVDEVVHNYGDLCQAITGLAFEDHASISVDEFRTLNRCLDEAIAGAVTEFSHQQESLTAGKGVQALNERLGYLAHELRNLIHTAMLAVSAMKSGSVGVTGPTSVLLDQSLIGLRNLIDRSLADVRMTAGMPIRSARIMLTDFIAEFKISASLEARARNCGLHVHPVEKELAVDADREMLASAINNLLQNAFKFTKQHTEVSLKAFARGDRVLIEIADHCGGLPVGAADKMFLPFTQAGLDNSGLGLGLSIARRSIEANHGVLGVRDIPGSGCVFTIDLPRASHL
jgi:signal transduction histidine kinase